MAANVAALSFLIIALSNGIIISSRPAGILSLHMPPDTPQRVRPTIPDNQGSGTRPLKRFKRDDDLDFDAYTQSGSGMEPMYQSRSSVGCGFDFQGRNGKFDADPDSGIAPEYRGRFDTGEGSAMYTQGFRPGNQ